MKPMIWHPEENDAKINQYLDHVNHAPYITISALLLVFLSLFTFIFLVSSF